MTQKIRHTLQLLQRIGNGNYTTNFHFDKEDEILSSVHQLQSQLALYKSEDERRQQNAAVLNEMNTILLENQNNLKGVYHTFISKIMKEVSGIQGGIFLAQNDRLVLEGMYAYDRKKYINHSTHLHEGINGEVFKSGEEQYITNLPSDYSNIIAPRKELLTPQCLFVSPIVYNGIISGVLEVFSPSSLNKEQRQFIKDCCHILGTYTIATKTNEQKIEFDVLEASVN